MPIFSGAKTGLQFKALKQLGKYILAGFLVAFPICLQQRCEASALECDHLLRIVGAFGALNNPGTPVPLSAESRAQLPKIATVRRVLDTNIGPSSEQVIVYDSAADDLEPSPTVAFLVGSRVVKSFAVFDLAPKGAGFESYLSSCEFEIAKNERALAIALSTAGDGAGSAFAIIKWESGDYRIVFNPLVSQGRMQLGVLKLELWDASFGRNAARADSPNFECIWCPHRYVVTEYLWRNGKYARAGSKRIAKMYDPADITGMPLSPISGN